MLLVGLTGGIGSGKTTVSTALAERGAVVIDADAIVHEVQRPGTEVFAEMVELFGPDIVDADGSLNRKAVAALVFGHPERLAALGKIVHPRVREEIANRVMAQLELDNIVVLDIPLLAESGWDGIEGTIVVDLDPELAVVRLAEFRGFDEADARSRIAAQASREERLAMATWVIDNSGDLAALEAAIAEVWADLVARHTAASADTTEASAS